MCTKCKLLNSQRDKSVEVLKCDATVDAQMSSASKIQADDKDRLLKRKQPRTPTKRSVFQEGGRD